MAGMLLPLGVLVLVLAVAAALALGVLARNQIKQLRSELDDTQRQLNDTRRELSELKAAAEAPPVVAPPPLPRSRGARLDDLREQLRASHREETGSEE
jgi:hypothetical protein